MLGVRRELRAPVTRAHRSRTLVPAPLLILFPVLRSIQVTLSSGSADNCGIAWIKLVTRPAKNRKNAGIEDAICGCGGVEALETRMYEAK